MAIQRETQGRILSSERVGEYTLLNNEKLGRVLDLIEGISEPVNDEEQRILNECMKLGKGKKGKNRAILALYDRAGGGVKLGDRKVAIGTFFDFSARAPRKEIKIDEDAFEDEQVLVRKRVRKGKTTETTAQRMKRLDAADESDESDEDEPEEEVGGEEEAEEKPKPKKKAAAKKKR